MFPKSKTLFRKARFQGSVETKDEKEEVDDRYLQAKSDGYWIPSEISLGDINPRVIEIPRLYNYHTPSSEWLENAHKNENKKNLSADDDSKEQGIKPDDSLQLFFKLEMAMFKAGGSDRTELFFSLYSSVNRAFLSEEYCVKLLATGFPEEGEREKLVCLFKNLTASTFHQEKLYVICRIIRIGDLKADKSNPNSEYRRPFAVSIMPVHKYLDQGLLSKVNSKDVFSPKNIPKIYAPINESTFFKLHDDIINGRSDQYAIAPQSNGLAVGFRLFNCPFSELGEILSELELPFHP